MKEQILNILLEQCIEFGKEDNVKSLLTPSVDTKLFHPDGNLDSLGLVRFISEVEEKIDEKFNKDIILADEKAMSRHSSPFLTVGTLCDYIFELLQDEPGNE